MSDTDSVSGHKTKAYGTFTVGNSACDFFPGPSPSEWQPLWSLAPLPVDPGIQVSFSKVVILAFCPQWWGLFAMKDPRVYQPSFLAHEAEYLLGSLSLTVSCLFPLLQGKLRQTTHHPSRLPRIRPFFLSTKCKRQFWRLLYLQELMENSPNPSTLLYGKLYQDRSTASGTLFTIPLLGCQGSPEQLMRP